LEEKFDKTENKTKLSHALYKIERIKVSFLLEYIEQNKCYSFGFQIDVHNITHTNIPFISTSLLFEMYGVPQGAKLIREQYIITL